MGDTIPLPKGVQCSWVQVQVQGNLPGGYLCCALVLVLTAFWLVLLPPLLTSPNYVERM